MTGLNTLKLNQATMVEAVQCWAETQFKMSIKITQVSKDSQAYGSVDCFIVECSSDIGEKEGA